MFEEAIMVFLRVFFPGYLSRRYNEYVRKYATNLIRFAQAFYGLKFEIDLPDEAELPERFLVVSNHQSLIDIVAFIAFFRTRTVLFVSKRELGKGLPSASRVLRMQGHALIDRRHNLVETAKELRRFSLRAKRRNSSVIVFPEGTRSKTGELGTFNAGAYRLVQAGVPMPVLVTAIEGGYQLRSFRSLSTGTASVYRMKVVGILDAPRGKAAIQESCDKSRALIEEQLRLWRRD